MSGEGGGGIRSDCIAVRESGEKRSRERVARQEEDGGDGEEGDCSWPHMRLEAGFPSSFVFHSATLLALCLFRLPPQSPLVLQLLLQQGLTAIPALRLC